MQLRSASIELRQRQHTRNQRAGGTSAFPSSLTPRRKQINESPHGQRPTTPHHRAWTWRCRECTAMHSCMFRQPKSDQEGDSMGSPKTPPYTGSSTNTNTSRQVNIKRVDHKRRTGRKQRDSNHSTETTKTMGTGSTLVSSSGDDAVFSPGLVAVTPLLLVPVQREPRWCCCCCCRCCCSGMLAWALHGDPFGLLFIINCVAQRVTSPEPLGNGMPEIACHVAKKDYVI